jgi:hypothetical protein
MLVLDTTTALVRLVTSAACDVQVNASYIDFTAPSTFTSDGQNTLITTATTTTIVSSPGASIKRNVTDCSIRNAHATTAVTIGVEQTDGTTATKIIQFTLLAGEYAKLNEQGTWFCYDINGAVKAGTGPGRWMKTTVLTSGTSHTTGALTTTAFVRVVAAGGGGGGCTSVAAAASAAGGGGAGGYAERAFVVSPSTAYAYTIGAAGTGVSGAAGNNGGNSTFVVGGTTVTAFGGTGGPVATALTTLVAYRGGAGGVVSTNGDLNAGGDNGEYGVTLIVATPIVASGNGGSGPFGGGGLGLTAVGAGAAASGFGAGGGGAATGASTVRTGGNGTAGIIVVDEYS